MVEFIVSYAKLLVANWQTALYGGIAVIGVIMALVGVLKLSTKNKIQSKKARKAIYFFSSLALVFPVTALCFLIEGINFRHYLVGCAMVALGVIVTYVLYENTLLRDLLQKIGRITICRWISGAHVDSKLVQEELKSAVAVVITSAEEANEDVQDETVTAEEKVSIAEAEEVVTDLYQEINAPAASKNVTIGVVNTARIPVWGEKLVTDEADSLTKKEIRRLKRL